MNQTIDIAKNELAKFKDGGHGDPQVDSAEVEGQSFGASGQAGQAGQFGQEGQYGAVRGAGFGGGLPKGSEAAPGDKGQGERKHRPSIYEGMEQGDRGYGLNAKGSSFSRANQMGTDDSPAVFGDDDDDQGQGYKTGTSTPGYRQEGGELALDYGRGRALMVDVDNEAAENRIKNQNVYGAQSDDRGSSGNKYNEAQDDEVRI